MNTIQSATKSKTISLLAVVAWLCGSLLTTGFGSPIRSAQLVSGATIVVNGTNDVIAEDGLCTLRKAVIAANTNMPSGGMSGECRAGKPGGNDIIVLVDGATYSLTINSTGEDESANGDLDIMDNGAGMDLIIRVKSSGSATISQDAEVDDRVLHILGATVKIEGVILRGGSTPDDGGGIAVHGGDLMLDRGEVSSNAAGWGGGISNSWPGTW